MLTEGERAVLVTLTSSASHNKETRIESRKKKRLMHVKGKMRLYSRGSDVKGRGQIQPGAQG